MIGKTINCHNNTYRKIGPFSDHYSFVPLFLMNSISAIIVVYNEPNKEYIFFLSIISIIFMFGYLYCGKRIIKYNKFISNSLLVRGEILETVWSNEINVYGRATVAAKYKYIDPVGKVHINIAIVHMFPWETPYLKQLNKWRLLYYLGKEISVLIEKNDFNISYLPMREDYCRKYKKVYSLDLNKFI